MQYRTLGKLGWNVSALGFGAMRLKTIKKDGKELVDEEFAISLIRSAIDKGINYIDTAWPYHDKQSEVIVGKALHDGYREKVRLVTKSPLWEINSIEEFDTILNKQLEKLQTDHIDMYLLHSLNNSHWDKVKQLNILEHMKKLKSEGKILAIAFSFHDSYNLFKEIIDSFEWDAAQIQFNYVDTNFQASLKGLNYAAEKNIPLIIMEPLRGGSLVRPNEKVNAVINSAETQRSLADWGLRYIWNYPGVAVILSGMNTFEMVEENIKISDTALPNLMNQKDYDIIKQLKDIFSQNIKVPCSFCEYCMPCPYGVMIPENFDILNGQSWDLKGTWFRSVYEGLAKTEEDINSSNNGNAGICTKCGECLDKCPQNIDIPTELEKVYKIFSLNEDFHKYY